MAYNVVSRLDARIAIVFLGAVAWVVAGLHYTGGSVRMFVAGLAIAAIGFAVMAWGMSRSRGVAITGLAAVLVGMGLFLGPNLLQSTSLASIATHAFIVSMLLVLAALVGSVARMVLYRVGTGLAAGAAVLWIVADVDGGMAWQPGNLGVLIGLVLTAIRPPLLVRSA